MSHRLCGEALRRQIRRTLETYDFFFLDIYSVQFNRISHIASESKISSDTSESAQFLMTKGFVRDFGREMM